MKHKFQLRFGLRSKLFLLSGFLFTLPWFGYQYVWEMEKYLRYGQEQTLVGTARALATALHERANLFDNQASFLPSVEKGKDLYGYQLSQAIQLDGHFLDWPNFTDRAHYYGYDHQLPQIVPDKKAVNKTDTKSDSTSSENHLIQKKLPAEELSLHFTATVGKYDKYLYLFFKVVDDHIIYRGGNSRSIINNDHIELAFVAPSGKFNRYIISNKTSGWLDAYRITDIDENIPVVASKIQGQWLPTQQGYNIELRVPLTEVGNNIAFAIHDVDKVNGEILTSVGSADPSRFDTLGTILVPSPEIERIVKGMSYTNSSIWVVDQHHRVLATGGDIKQANGVWNTRENSTGKSGFWHNIEQNWLLPLYYKVLTKPSNDFIDQLYDAGNLTGKHIESAMSGKAQSQWRLTQDKKALILSAAYPIFINNKVQGAVIVEETTNGIRTLRNRALEKLFSSILAIISLGTLAFFLFATRISSRIRLLRNQAELAIDEHGRINFLDGKNVMPASTTNDEIGDLSRSFSTAVNRLSQYNHYLENMSSRLSHELRTPIAIVRTSLENLGMQSLPESANAYIERAQSGINRLNLILTNMSEATRIEQMLHTTDKVAFDFNQVVTGCLQGYQQIFPNIKFVFNNNDSQTYPVLGSPEHIAQLLDKVIANAVEFSQDKQVVVSLNKVNKSELVLTISNKGPLLPEEMKDRLFDSMVSVRSAAKQKQPHLGLGLYIARLICEFHQAKISADNNYEPDGVTITLSVPMTLGVNH
ncbi:MAG: proteobacterial dedicated sortase system histidine kinase [Alteromonadaceae bacterium]|nr:proteobacterial dedicated sortase system histidine kinase [Alteromonadaceae bacterium]